MHSRLLQRWALLLRHRAARNALAEMDDHRLDDLGLRRGDLERGVICRSAMPHGRPDFLRRSALTVRGWAIKLYVPTHDDIALRSEDYALAGRAVAATIAEPGAAYGLAILRRSDAVGTLGLACWCWEGDCLHATGLDLPADGTRHRAGTTELHGEVIALLAREWAAWRRHVLEPGRPDHAAYMREDCA